MNGKAPVEVRESPIHGMGLFAAEAIPADTLILHVKGRRTKEDGPHVLWISDDEGVAEGLLVTNEARYVNHDDDPNACYFEDELWSLRRIPAGQEITHDYEQ